MDDPSKRKCFNIKLCNPQPQEILDLQDAKQKFAGEIRSKDFRAGQAFLGDAPPPAPQEEQMRASQLYSFADLDVGLLKAVETVEKTTEPIIEPPIPQPVEANPLAKFTAIQGLLPPNFTIQTGWKPDMPVQLPTDLPIKPPPGWKPGDSVPLPPMDSLSVPVFDEQQVRPHVPLHKPPYSGAACPFGSWRE